MIIEDNGKKILLTQQGKNLEVKNLENGLSEIVLDTDFPTNSFAWETILMLGANSLEIYKTD